MPVKKERKQELNRLYYLNNRERLRTRRKITDAIYRKVHKEQIRKKPYWKFQRYKWSAKKRGYRFTLTNEEFKSFWGKECFYCGDKIISVGLDRIDNKRGYSIKNVAACCIKCNKMKGILTYKEFISQCKKIRSHQIGRGLTHTTH